MNNALCLPVDRGMEACDYSRHYFDNSVLDTELLVPGETLDAWHVAKLRVLYDAEMRVARARLTIDLSAGACVVRLDDGGSVQEFVAASTGRAIVEAVAWVRSVRGGE